jgi:hypothetical protein
VTEEKQPRYPNTQAQCPHDHWLWPSHAPIQGRRASETVVVRQCNDCGLKQMAVIKNRDFRKATGDYTLEEHYR